MKKRTLKNDFLQLEYSTDALRVTGLIPTGKQNLLAELIDETPLPTPYGDFYFRGGHRLWHAPEAMPRTYIPDREIFVSEILNGVILETQPEPETGIRKRIEIQLAQDSARVVLTHTLINDGLWEVTLAPWTITQFRLGGAVILPMPVGNVDAAGLLPNRQISFWSYSKINDPRLQLGDEFTFFKGEALPAFKMGYFNPHGWMAYWNEGVLFRKTFSAQKDSLHPDNNCNAEIYGCEQFVELESLAPLQKLSPGDSAQHIETWDIFSDVNSLPQELQRAIESL